MSETPIEVLTRWEDHGGVWRAAHLTERLAVVRLCSCTGEAVDELRSGDPDLLRYLAMRPSSDVEPGSDRPMAMLAQWLDDARAAGLPEHDAAALATVDATGNPTARMVSLRRVEDEALIFTTAMWTRKARDLRENPNVAMLLHWPSLGRQIQVGGRAEPAERSLAEELFARRDRPHQLQSMVSRQGEPIADLAPLRRQLARVRRNVADGPVPCPPDWSAMRIHPRFVEFWEAAADALHDRTVFERDGSRWRRSRLAP